MNHGTRPDAALCFDGPDGARCAACDATGNMTPADRARRKRLRAKLQPGATVTQAVTPAPDARAAHGPTGSRDASRGPRDGAAGAAAIPGRSRPAQGGSGPHGATMAPGAATVAGPGWAIPEVGPPGLRTDLAAWLATVAAGGQAARLTTRQEDGQENREYKRELKDVAEFLREFKKANTGMYFHYQGLSHSDGYPMKGFSYTAWYVTFISDDSPEPEYIPPANPAPKPARTISRPVIQDGMGPGTRAQFIRDSQQRDAQARQLAAARREESEQQRIVTSRQRADCDNNVHGPRITDPVSGKIECGWCQEILWRGYASERYTT